jgi:hypothetical protein
MKFKLFKETIFFQLELCVEGRQRIIKVLKKEGFKVITLSKESTHFKAVGHCF